MSSYLSIPTTVALVAMLPRGATIIPSVHPAQPARYETVASDRMVRADSDSIVVTVTNSMTHDWEIFLERSGGTRTSLGTIDGGASHAFSVDRVPADSVTMVAVSIMGEVTKKFPTRAKQPLNWDL